MKYRKKPVVIDAVQWTGTNHREMFDFLTDYQCTDQYMSAEGKNFYIDHWKVPGGLVIKTLEGEHLANIGDYINDGLAEWIDYVDAIKEELGIVLKNPGE